MRMELFHLEGFEFEVTLFSQVVDDLESQPVRELELVAWQLNSQVVFVMKKEDLQRVNTKESEDTLARACYMSVSSPSSPTALVQEQGSSERDGNGKAVNSFASHQLWRGIALTSERWL